VWTLLDDLNAFYLEHGRCGRLDTGIKDGRVWMMCECGGRIVRDRSTSSDANMRKCVATVNASQSG